MTKLSNIQKKVQKKKDPVVPVLRNMNIGQSHEWAIGRFLSIRTMAYNVGLKFNMTFTSTLDRGNGKIIVKRVA